MLVQRHRWWNNLELTLGHWISCVSVVSYVVIEYFTHGHIRLASVADNNRRCLSGELKVIYHPLYSMNNFVTNKSKLPQDGAQVFPYMG